MPLSTINRALSQFHYTLKRVKLVPERRNYHRTIAHRTAYATSYRALEVDNDDKAFVFLDEVGFSVVTRPSRGRSVRKESHIFLFLVQEVEIFLLLQP